MLLKLLLATLLFSLPGRAQVHVLTANGNNDRTNSNLQESRLSPATVDASTFGKLGAFSVDGQVFSQPLVVSGLAIPGKGTRNVVFVSTMHNSVYAFDADAMSPVCILWQVNLGTPVPAPLLFGQYGDITHEVGILSTGVIDLNRGILYVVAEVFERGKPVFYLHALDLATGAGRLNGPVALSASVPGTGAGSLADGTLPFDPMQQIQRPALLLANHSVYVGFGSHGDQVPYHGWMLTYDAADLRRSVGAHVSTPDGNGGAIWQSGRGPAADRQGNIYAVAGNGDYDGVRNFGESFLKLPATASTTLDSYTPVDWKVMSDNDFDLSAGPALIPGTHTFIGADKLGNLYVIDGDAMSRPGGAAITAASEGSIFNFAVWSSGTGARVYTQGGREPLKCFHVTSSGINPEPVSTAANSIPFARIGLTVSANGDQEDSGILWESAGNYNDTSAPGTLLAYDASNLARVVWTSDMNPARDRLPPVAKFVAPTVANGKVNVPSSANVVTVYGLFSPPAGNADLTPSIYTVANAASYSQNAVAPGELVVICGSSLGPASPQDFELDASGSVATTLAGAQVLFDGVASPMIFASAGQLNAVVPSSVSAPIALVQVQYQNQLSATYPVNVVPAAIGIFSADASGTGQALALNRQGGHNSADNPGSVVALWVTGTGQFSPAEVDGGLPHPALPVLAFVDDQAAEAWYSDAAPGLIPGMIQVSVRIPPATQPGVVSLLLHVGESSSQPGITLAIASP